MNAKKLIENEADEFCTKVINTGYENDSLEYLKGKLKEKVNVFDSDLNKKIFLAFLKKRTLQRKSNYERIYKPKKGSLNTDRFDRLTLLVDQESNNLFFIGSSKEKSNLSKEDISIILKKLDKIERKIRKTNLGNEVIFDEIENLRLSLPEKESIVKQLAKGLFTELVKAGFVQYLPENIEVFIDDLFDPNKMTSLIKLLSP